MAGHQTSNAERALTESFGSYYEGWITKHEEFQEKLLECVREEEESKEIVSRVLAHYEDFFHEKSKAAIEDVFLVISPPWFSSFERTLVWISAFKPSLVFSLVKNSVGEELSPYQSVKMEKIKADIGRKEKDLEKELARVQEGVAGDGVLNLARRFETLVDGEISELDTAIGELKAAMLMVVEKADALRGITVKKVMKVMEPSQNVKFLVAVGQFIIRARKWGIHRDSQSASATSA